MASASNSFSFFVGGLALVSTLLSGLLYFRGYFPSAQMKLLDELLAETKGIYDKANTEGFLPQEVAISAKADLDQCEEQRDSLCEMIYRAHTLYEKFVSMLRGQTMSIMRLVAEVEKLRAFIMTTQEKEKARLRRQDAQPHNVSAASMSESTERTNEPPGSTSSEINTGLCLSFLTQWWRSPGPAEDIAARDCDSASMTSTLINEPSSSAQRWWDFFTGRNKDPISQDFQPFERPALNQAASEVSTAEADVGSLPV